MKQPATTRAEHLTRVTVPMLFVQGTNDDLATPALLRPVVAALGSRATLVEIQDADHGFAVPRRTGKTDAEIRADIAAAIAAWLDALPPGP